MVEYNGATTRDYSLDRMPQTLPELFAKGLVKGIDGKKYGVVAGVIRNISAGNGYWQPITDTDHQNTNFGTVTTTADYINIVYAAGLNFTKVVSLVAIPDDSLTQQGVSCGTSVGRTECRIYLSKVSPFTDRLEFVPGTGWVSQSGKTVVTAPEVTNTYTFTHPDIGNAVNNISLTSGHSKFIPNITDEASIATKVSGTFVKVQFRDFAGALMSASAGPDYPILYLSHGGGGALNPQGVDVTNYPGSNIWIYGLFEL